MRSRIGIVGAGLSGAVVARRLAEAGIEVVVFDARGHVAGNCHTERDTSGVMVHRYGAHLFHTGLQNVWSFMQRFAEFVPYEHRVRASTQRGIFSLPVNLLTINTIWGLALAPNEARSFLEAQREPIAHPSNFEEQSLATVGRELYDTFFRGYTTKQWGRDPREIPASVAARLPVRFSYDDRYFTDPYQAQPRDGFTDLVERMLDHPALTVNLGVRADATVVEGFDHVVWTGPLDAFFGHQLGRLPYRTLRFEHRRGHGDLQGASVINYCDERVLFTRMLEHKHFSPWEQHDDSVVTTEFSAEAGPGDDPYYPVRHSSFGEGNELLRLYEELALSAGGVSFLGRLGTFRYLDMDVTVGEALLAADQVLEAVAAGRTIPPFFERLRP